MLMKPILSPQRKKSLTYSVFILLILGTFILGYFYYYIPKNKETLQKNGFVILKTIADNVQAKNSGRVNFYKNIFRNTPHIDSIQKLLDQNQVTALIGYSKSSIKRDKRSGLGKDPSFSKLRIENKYFIYSIAGGADTLVFSEPASSFLQPMLVTQKTELFENYALINIEDKESNLLFHDTTLALRSDIKLNNLLSDSISSYFPGFRDIASQNFNQKMFYYPFEVDSVQLVLCGFVQTKHYNEAIRQVPFHFTYPLAIVFLLLLVFLPILKFYIMDSSEQVRIRDLALFGLSVFIGSSVITLVIIQSLLWKVEEERAAENLKKLSAQIKKSFTQELDEIYHQLSTLDSVRKNDGSLRERIDRGTTVNYSDNILRFIRTLNKNNEAFHAFDRVSWINSTGMQIVKAEMKGDPLFTNVKDRAYFQAFETNNPLFLNRADSIRIGWEPVYSWTNGDFNILISKETEGFIVAMATKMHSLVNTILPVGYGFCIIDKEGKVQIHADVNRNLRENLFEKAEPSDEIMGAVAARQAQTINNVTIYGKLHTMHVDPLKGSPYTLVTFYDKGFIVPINMRILIFALLFCLFSGAICTILWLTLSRITFKKHPLLYCPMDCLTWLSPQKKEATYYFHAFIFLIFYVGLFLVFIGLYRSSVVSNYTVFSLVFLTPLNIVCVLFAMRAAYNNAIEKFEVKQQQKINRRVIWIAAIHAAITATFYYESMNLKWPIDITFILFQCIFVLWILVYRLFGKKYSVFSINKMENYQQGYNWMATMLVICLSVLPGGLYTWYAHNQEIIQTVKKQQLHLGNSIQDRSYLFQNISGMNDSSLIPENYFNRLFFEKGIYTINSDTAYKEERSRIFLNSHAKNQPHEQFYFAIAEKLSNRYYDPELYPALKDSADDNSWGWLVKDSLVHLRYTRPLPLRHAGFTDQSVLYLKSELPERFRFLTTDHIDWLLMLFVVIALLLWGLFRWIGINTANVFLIKYINSAKDIGHLKLKVVNDYNAKVSPGDCIKDDEIFAHHNYKNYTVNTEENVLNRYEKEVLATVQKGRGLYDYIWKECSQKEQYLLYDFARDGLVNFKNTKEIYALISRGILLIDDDKLRLFSPAFRAYLVMKTDTAEINQLHKEQQKNSAWGAFRGPLLLLLLGFAAVIFFTQEAMFQKILALAGGIGTIISLVPKFFSGGNSKPPDT